MFDPGETTKTFVVPILGDEVDEDDEQFTADARSAVQRHRSRGEHATVTIVDDDGTGGSAAVSPAARDRRQPSCSTCSTTGAPSTTSTATGPSPFELPGLTDELAGLYEPQDDLDALDSPFSGLDDDLAALCGQLAGPWPDHRLGRGRRLRAPGAPDRRRHHPGPLHRPALRARRGPRLHRRRVQRRRRRDPRRPRRRASASTPTSTPARISS